MVVYKGFEVTIQVNDRDLEEFKDDVNQVDRDSNDPVDGNTVTRYVEATSNAQFSIHCQYVDKGNLPGGRKVKGILYGMRLDGTSIVSPIGSSPAYECFRDKALEHKDGQVFARDLLFSDLQIVDTEPTLSKEEKARTMTPKIRKVGTIEVDIVRLENVWAASPAPPSVDDAIFGKEETVPETALKGDSKSHYIQFGIPKAGKSNHKHFKRIDSAKKPYAKFRFKYCSRECLERMYIVPRPPSLEERNVQDLSREEMMQLVYRLKKSIAEQPQVDHKIKQEPGTSQVIGVKRPRDSDDDDVTATEERSVRRLPLPNETDEVVDLTED